MNRNLALSKNVAIIGIGGCGTNIAFQFEKNGYKTLHINSSTQDESAIKGAKNVRHLVGFNGCAGKRTLAEEALSRNQELIDEIAGLEEEIIYLIFSAAGGTGSGLSPLLAQILTEETQKTICCAVVLPDVSEDYDYHVNAYNCCKELYEIERLGSVVFLDNNSNPNKLSINSSFCNMLNAFLTNNSVSVLGNVDGEEKRTMVAQNGSFILSMLSPDKANDENVVEKLTTKNIFAPLQKDGACEYIAIINSGKNGINKEEVINVVGTPKRTFMGYESNSTIIAVSGLSFPFDHINSLKALAKERHEERMKARTKVLTGFDDIAFEDTVIKREVKREEKKLSARDRLRKFSE